MATDDDCASTAEHTPDAPPSRTATNHHASPADDTAYDWLPDDRGPRPYIAIRPGDAPLNHRAVQSAMRRLVTTLHDATSWGKLAELTGSTLIPRIEILLVADGNPDTGLQYLVGTDPVDDDLRSSVRDSLRTALPNDTELTATQFHPLEVRRYCDPPQSAQEVAAVEHAPEADGAYVDPAPDENLPPAAEPYAAAVEYLGAVRDRRDWQTPLAPFTELVGDTQGVAGTRVPLAYAAETLADAGVPAIYQTVVRPHRDWAVDAAKYTGDMEIGRAGVLDKISDQIWPRGEEEYREYEPPLSDQARIEGIDARNPSTTVAVSARAVALTRRERDAADGLASRLTSVFAPVGGEFHLVRGRTRRDSDRGIVGTAVSTLPYTNDLPPGKQVYSRLVGTVGVPPAYERVRARLPFTTPTSRGIVVSPAELAAFCVAGGAELPPTSARALGTQRPARTGLALPPPRQLARYRGAGWPLGRPLDSDRRDAGAPVVLPPGLQPLHLLVVGATGAGKSTTLTTGMLANHDATDGPAVLFDAKGGGMARDYLRAHDAKYGDLEDVVYFDCTHTLPAVGAFDLRPLLDAGVSREEARSRIAGHYEEILSGVMGAERYASAVRSPDVITNHLKALFDPVHGDDAIAHRDLVDALRRTQRDGEPPAVTDDSLDAHFQSLLDSEPRVFSQVLGGALSRVETIATDGRLAPLFNHVPEREADGQDSGHETVGYGTTGHIDSDETEPSASAGQTGPDAFSFTDLLDEDKTVIFDFGGMENSVKDTLTMVLLSQLWTALKARHERAGGGEGATDHALVNLYLEDAGSVAGTELVDTLLSQGRSFGLSVTLGVQYPGQLETTDPARDTYREVLNETATMLIGNVRVDDDLARALATADLPPDELARRLGALERGGWLCRPAAAFGEAPPAPFLVESLDPPAGHPASDEPVDERAFRSALADCRARTTDRHGISLHEVSGVDGASETAGDATDDEAGPEETLPRHTHLRTTLAHTGRLPSCVSYSEPADALHCVGCSTRYDPTDAGMVRAIECCGGVDSVDRAEIPVVQANLKLTPEAVVDSTWSLQQLLFLQVVHNAQQGRYDAPGYDIVHDSMVRLREYAGVGTDDVVELKDAGLLVEDGDHPHRLYSVTSDGRDVIREGRREGLDYGDGKGDLDETSQHRMAVEVGRRYIEHEFADDPASRVQRAKPYHEIEVDGETRRLDCAGLDDEGEVMVALEAERINHDVNEAVPADFDKMAACDPDEAIWVTLSRSDGARVVEALADPPDGEPRVETTYNERTATHKYQIDTPGLTDVFTVTYVRDTLLSEE